MDSHFHENDSSEDGNDIKEIEMVMMSTQFQLNAHHSDFYRFPPRAKE